MIFKVTIAMVVACGANKRSVELKGVSLEMTEAQVKEKVPGLLCTSLAGEPGKRQCYYSRKSPLKVADIAVLNTFAEQPAESWAFILYEDRLGMVNIDVESEPQSIIGAIQAKYGAPTETIASRTRWHAKSGLLDVMPFVSGRALVSLYAPWFEARAKQGEKSLATTRTKDM